MRCKICGFGSLAAIHLPALSGPRKGEPYGHAYVPADYPDPPADPRPGEYEPGTVPAPSVPQP